MKAKPSSLYTWVVYAAAAGFVSGMVVMAALFTIFPIGPWSATERPAEAAAMPVPASTPPQTVAAIPTIGADPVAELRGRRLELPVKGSKPDDIQDTFDDKRGTARRHEAIDVLAERHTPVVAVEDGTITRLFLSDAGGITIYQFDPSSSFCYYYAHLQAYADGLKEGDKVKRGDVIGYVGTTGNAPKDTPHLHFAIFQLTDKKQWWQGTPVDPYKVLR